MAVAEGASTEDEAVAKGVSTADEAMAEVASTADEAVAEGRVKNARHEIELAEPTE